MAASIPGTQTTRGWIKEMLNETKSEFAVGPIDEMELV